MATGNKIILGIPKGSLQESTFAMMKKAGFSISVGSRSYIPTVDDPEIEARLIRAQEISRYVEQGLLDAGLTGFDWITENQSDVHEVANLVYSKQELRPVRWVLAVPNASSIQSAKDLEGKRIATEAVGLTKQYLARHGVKAEVEFSWGATEVKAPELVDAIVEITETGSSLRANNLRIVDTVLESTTRFIANKKSWADSWKREKIENLALLLRSVLAAESKVLLKLNVNEANLKPVTALLPALHSPTIMPLSGSGWYAVETVVDNSALRTLIPKLKAAGAEGIIELSLNKIIP
ncbi:MAG: ATP phosphoribosyltransferase [Kiritimatiellae bacterium]|nr:ATP phosphoribosyltransferase [Kiritimatiellia bacterium]MCO5062726.1 ATP phosphoribosyltransferase [Kiritimatiellia bacterium]MCO6400454.1 ATP phosphoribosyltransferase [Verrucomicrobiota bacterium]